MKGCREALRRHDSDIINEASVEYQPFKETPLYPERDLSYDFLGIRLENPFILAAGPSTDDLSMVRRAFSMGWAGAILKTTSIEGTRVDLAYPMMSSFDHDGKKLFGMGNIDLISEHHVDLVEYNVRVLKKEFPDKMVAASIMAGRKEDWQKLVERLEQAGADLIECSFSCPQGNIGESPGKMLAQSIAATETTARWVKEASRNVPKYALIVSAARQPSHSTCAWLRPRSRSTSGPSPITTSRRFSRRHASTARSSRLYAV